jgi:hypothetical protein
MDLKTMKSRIDSEQYEVMSQRGRTGAILMLLYSIRIGMRLREMRC